MRHGFVLLAMIFLLSACGGDDPEPLSNPPPQANQPTACTPQSQAKGCTCTQVDVGVFVGVGTQVVVSVCCDSNGCRGFGSGQGGTCSNAGSI